MAPLQLMQRLGAVLRLLMVVMVVVVVPAVYSAPMSMMVRRDTDDPDSAAQPDVTTLDGQMAYLRSHAWLGETNPNQQIAGLTDAQALEEAISEFQRFAGLDMTGEMDEATIQKMAQPRCGVPDNFNMATQNKRRKRYALQGSRWGKPDLSYRINHQYYTPDLDNSKVDEVIRQAFQAWSDVTPLTFAEKSSGNVDIDIEFREGSHGDGNTFDGKGGTLAHAFFPEFGGDAHFDESETWSHGEYQGTNLLQVAIHELGHSLGLSHSDVQTAVMAPFYSGYNPSFKLEYDDIHAIQTLYGKKPTGSSTTTTTSRPPVRTTPSATSRPAPDICRDGTFDAVTTTEDLLTGATATYAFRGDQYVKLDDYGIAKGYPRSIRSDWVGLPSDVDAALHWSSSDVPGHTSTARTYFFKGSQYYKFETRGGVHQMLGGYPQDISAGFPGIPSDVNAAFVWSGNGKTYFIKDNMYYRYKRGSGLDQGYPKDLGLWNGLPARIDAAFEWTNGKTYFFNGPNYYRFNDNSFTVDSGYPRLNAIWWLGCPEQSGSSMAEVEETEMGQEDDNIFRDVETVGDTSGAQSHLSQTTTPLVVCLLLTSLIRALLQRH